MPVAIVVPEPNPQVCSPNPCWNGVCTPLSHGFHCACRPGVLHHWYYKNNPSKQVVTW